MLYSRAVVLYNVRGWVLGVGYYPSCLVLMVTNAYLGFSLLVLVLAKLWVLLNSSTQQTAGSSKDNCTLPGSCLTGFAKN